MTARLSGAFALICLQKCFDLAADVVCRSGSRLARSPLGIGGLAKMADSGGDPRTARAFPSVFPSPFVKFRPGT